MNTPASPLQPAVVLVNLGTPDAPTPKAVRRYLAEFLHDHRVVALTRWLWCPILHFVILPFRSPRVAKLYAGVWMDGGSPLAVHTARLADAVQREMPEARVVHAMRYGNPSLRTVLQQLRDAGHPRVQVLPLYPQYSTTTTASVGDVVTAVFGDSGVARMRDDYHVDPDWVEAVADSIRAHWDVHGRGERLLFSFHGIPQRLADAGDPYPLQCWAGCDAIVRALGLHEDEALLTFQSRFGREPWLQPYTDETLKALGGEGVRDIDVVCPGFAVDCLETLEEIALQNAEIFHEHGGRRLRYIPCLNDAPAHAQALAALVRRDLAERA
ncbi:ferrochelatase [Luteimonas deserti]|uniref:Ferrochelatase n=1 Tax=Luteimonas deserti TaxID=2752306 RepID=A0A7Z0TY73_9GAMM|nr:ferrochelatase [Luteimonas deserti]NYZ62077.1 ferrochelatase [Luteimonas deserti]